MWHVAIIFLKRGGKLQYFVFFLVKWKNAIIFAPHFCEAQSQSTRASCSDGGIGRHEGLKIPWPLRLGGFKSHSEYLNNAIKALQINYLQCFCFNSTQTIHKLFFKKVNFSAHSVHFLLHTILGGY